SSGPPLPLPDHLSVKRPISPYNCHWRAPVHLQDTCPGEKGPEQRRSSAKTPTPSLSTCPRHHKGKSAPKQKRHSALQYSSALSARARLYRGKAPPDNAAA